MTAWTRARPNGPVAEGQITVFLADDNLIVREGVRALLNLEADLIGKWIERLVGAR